MGRVPRKGTLPELMARKANRMGLRYRLNREDLPGRPDLVFARHRLAAFVHECFWHRHKGSRTTTPKSNREYWLQKFRDNQPQDRRSVRALESMGRKRMVVWECEAADAAVLAIRMAKEFRA